MWWAADKISAGEPSDSARRRSRRVSGGRSFAGLDGWGAASRLAEVTPRARFDSMIHQLKREQVIAGSPEAVWDFFATPRNLDRITPASMSFQVVHGGDEQMYAGQMIEYRIGAVPVVDTHNDMLVGIVSYVDALRAARELLARE